MILRCSSEDNLTMKHFPIRIKRGANSWIAHWSRNSFEGKFESLEGIYWWASAMKVQKPWWTLIVAILTVQNSEITHIWQMMAVNSPSSPSPKVRKGRAIVISDLILPKKTISIISYYNYLQYNYNYNEWDTIYDNLYNGINDIQ